ncbi:MAG: hypothetical protein E3J54_03415 [Actinobacteria bacterium]|nr:MAG: hypothetical protein E3J54_03415 [Actinomycetota bacterium]
MSLFLGVKVLAKRKGISVSEAGRRGGLKVRKLYGSEFYEAIGRKGGKKGGKVVKQKYGSPFYKEIGHKGGQKVRRLINKGKKSLK